MFADTTVQAWHNGALADMRETLGLTDVGRGGDNKPR